MSFGPELQSHKSQMVTLHLGGHQLLMFTCHAVSCAESMPVASMDTPSAEFPMAEKGAPNLAEDTPDHPSKAEDTEATTEQTEPEPQIASRNSAAQVSAV